MEGEENLSVFFDNMYRLDVLQALYSRKGKLDMESLRKHFESIGLSFDTEMIWKSVIDVIKRGLAEGLSEKPEIVTSSIVCRPIRIAGLISNKKI